MKGERRNFKYWVWTPRQSKYDSYSLTQSNTTTSFFRFGSAPPFKVPIESLEKEAKIIDPNDYQAVLAETKELFNSENPFLNLLEPSSLVPVFPESQSTELNAFDRNFMMGSLNEGTQLQRELEALLQDVNVFN